jgi:hypothetical protein
VALRQVKNQEVKSLEQQDVLTSNCRTIVRPAGLSSADAGHEQILRRCGKNVGL